MLILFYPRPPSDDWTGMGRVRYLKVRSHQLKTVTDWLPTGVDSCPPHPTSLIGTCDSNSIVRVDLHLDVPKICQYWVKSIPNLSWQLKQNNNLPETRYYWSVLPNYTTSGSSTSTCLHSFASDVRSSPLLFSIPIFQPPFPSGMCRSSLPSVIAIRKVNSMLPS